MLIYTGKRENQLRYQISDNQIQISLLWLINELIAKGSTVFQTGFVQVSELETAALLKKMNQSIPFLGPGATSGPLVPREPGSEEPEGAGSKRECVSTDPPHVKMFNFTEINVFKAWLLKKKQKTNNSFGLHR